VKDKNIVKIFCSQESTEDNNHHNLSATTNTTTTSPAGGDQVEAKKLKGTQKNR
jgi:hypothetical protein